MNQDQIEKAEQEVKLASYTEQVKKNPAYKSAMMLIRADLFNKITNIKSTDIEGIKDLKSKLDAVEAFQSELENIMAKGRIAEHRLTKFQKFTNKLKGK